MAATPEPRTRADGTVAWRVRYRDDGHQHSETFATERAARDFARLVDTVGGAQARAILDHRDAETSAPTPTLREWASRHIDGLAGVEEGTRRRYRSIVTRDLHDLADLPVDAITPDAVRAWVRRLERAGASGKTIRNKHALLSSTLAAAVTAGHIPNNPAHGIRLPRTVRQEMVCLTHADYAVLLDATPPRWRPLVAFLAGSGLRWSEATALKVGDINADGGTVHVARAWKYTAGEGHRLGPPKSAKSRRTVQLAPETLDALRPLLERPAGAWLFVNRDGGPVRSGAFHEAWRQIVEDADLGKSPRVHDLRHTCASWLLASGIPMPYVQAHLGHESITTTVGTYGHLLPDARRAVAVALSHALTAAHPMIESGA